MQTNGERNGLFRPLAGQRAEGDRIVKQLADNGIKIPYVTLSLIVSLSLIFSAEVIFTAGQSGESLEIPVEPLIRFGGVSHLLVFTGECWRLFSAPLLHASAFHLLANILGLVIMGSLEILIGSAWFAATFFVGAIVGAVSSVSFNAENLVSVGASGGIVALFVATLLASSHLPSGAERSQFIIIAGRALFPALIPDSTSGGENVDYAAHFGGAIGGAIISVVFLKIWSEKLARPKVPWGAYAVAILLAAASYGILAFRFTVIGLAKSPVVLSSNLSSEISENNVDTDKKPFPATILKSFEDYNLEGAPRAAPEKTRKMRKPTRAKRRGPRP